MTETNLLREREQAIHLLRAGKSVREVAETLKRHPNWVRKWQKRHREEGWGGLRSRSRAPVRHGRKLPEEVRQAVCQARSEVEAEAKRGDGLKYIGAPAVRTKLKEKGITPLPSLSSIERIMRACGLTKKQKKNAPEITYPHLKPDAPQQLCQVDIVPHFLSGGERVACFNAIDVVSRYPVGQAFSQRRSEDALAFLLQTWQEAGIPRYTQLDNEGCFSGGASHQYVLGKVLRLGLTVGTEIVFSPFYHPQSNGYVERFHQDYNRHVWDGTYLHDIDDVQRHADKFFQAYRQSTHHSALKGHFPDALHHQQSPNTFPVDFSLPPGKLPLREGKVHFIRRIDPDGTVKVLNARWRVPEPDFNKGVWVTIEFQQGGATLHIYDAAPDETDRKLLASHPFPLKEEVLPFENSPATTQQPQTALLPLKIPASAAGISAQMLVAAVARTVRLTARLVNTMH